MSTIYPKLNINKSCIFLLLMTLLWPLSVQAELLRPFSAMTSLDDGWEPLVFPRISRHTHYQLVEKDGEQVVQADADKSASGLITRLEVSPEDYPRLQWRWQVSNTFEKGDARRKSGDDYPARIYVAFAFEPQRASLLERAKRRTVRALFGEELPGNALNYIWANTLPEGDVVPNPFTEQTMMIAVTSGDAQVGEWVTVERNILEDYRAAFGTEPPAIVGIGIMSDADNTGERATAWYGDIRLLPAAE